MSENAENQDRDEEQPSGEDAKNGEDSPKGPLARWIAVSLAAIAVVGAGIGILQTDASVNESNTARETTRTAVAALRGGVVEETTGLLEQDIDAEQGALTRQQRFLATESGDASEPLTPAQLREVFPDNTGLERARTRAGIRGIRLDSERLGLKQAALAETRVTWNDRSTQYTTAIAVLAFALFLVGFSLVLQGRRRIIFYSFGLLVAILVVSTTVYIRSLPIPETPDLAIEATARGTIASDDGRQERAIALFDEAIEDDSDYATAYSRRALARTLAVNPDFEATGAFSDREAAFSGAIEDAQRALELDDGRDLLTRVLLSVAALYAGEYERSIRAANEAIEVNSQIPDIRLVKSAAEVGAGREAAAVATLDAVSDLIAGIQASERTRGLVANYLTYLEQVVREVPERQALVSRLEQRVVGIETEFNLDRPVSGELPARGSVRVEDLRYRDGQFQLRTDWRNLPNGTALTLIGFERPTPDSGWVQPDELALFLNVGGSGTRAGQVDIKRNCEPVQVRVDAYLDGALFESFTGPGVEPTC